MPRAAPSYCPYCAGGLTPVRQIYETVRGGKHARVVHVCAACEIKVSVQRMPKRFTTVRKRRS